MHRNPMSIDRHTVFLFQHFPYLDDFNKEQGTDLVNAADIHVEPMGLYGGRQTTLDALNVK